MPFVWYDGCMQFSLCIRIKQQNFCLQTKRHKVVFLSAALAVCSTLLIVSKHYLASIPKCNKCVDLEEAWLEGIYKDHNGIRLFIAVITFHFFNYPENVHFTSDYLDHILTGLIKTVCRARHNTQVILYSNAKERSSSSSLLIFPM